MQAQTLGGLELEVLDETIQKKIKLFGCILSAILPQAHNNWIVTIGFNEHPWRLR